MRTSSIDVVILAAGEGKRMGTDIPKPLRTIHGKSFLHHLMGTITHLEGVRHVYIVTNARLQGEVQRLFPQCTVLLQSSEKGTAKAMQAYVDQISLVDRAPRALVLPADVPLIPLHCLHSFLHHIPQGDGVIVFRPPKDSAYGRVISNCDGTIEIVEAKDCTHHHASITLRNTGVYLLTQSVLGRLHDISNDNAQNEYYLTDIFRVSDAHVRLHKIQSSDNLRFYGVNTMEELRSLEEMASAVHAQE